MAVCPQCGASVSERDTFCKGCGISLAKDFQRQRKISRTSASRKSIQNRGDYYRKIATGRKKRLFLIFAKGYLLVVIVAIVLFTVIYVIGNYVIKEEADIQIISQELNCSTAADASYHMCFLEGYCVNTGNREALRVTIHADFFDDKGIKIKSNYDYTRWDLKAGESSHYRIQYWNEKYPEDIKVWAEWFEWTEWYEF